MSENELLYPSMKLEISDIGLFVALDTVFAGDEFRISTNMHAHAYYEIMAVVDGGMRMDFAGRGSMVMDAGSICFIPPGVYHCSGLLDAVPKKLAVRFTVSRASRDGEYEPVYTVCEGLLRRQKEPVIFTDGELAGLLERMYAETISSGLASDVYMRLLLEEFLIGIFRLLERDDRAGSGTAAKPLGTSERDSRYLRIEKFFEDHLSGQVTEQDLADYLSLSKRQTSRTLMDIYHLSFRTILTDNRMQRAAQMLVSTDLPVEDIAYRVGYTSVSGFYTAFGQKFGTSAGQYRRENKR